MERALEESGDDLDSAIRSLNELRLGSSAATADVPLEANVHAQGINWIVEASSFICAFALTQIIVELFIYLEPNLFSMQNLLNYCVVSIYFNQV